MRNAYKKFKQLIDDTKNVDALYQYTKSISVPIDTSDLLRWQWVQAVSALDKLVHDLVKIGMLEEFNGTRTRTSQFEKFPIDMNLYSNMSANPLLESNYFEQRIIVCNGYKSFQDPRKISEALSYIWTEKHKWNVIASLMGMTEADCTTKLNNIVIRRNQIAHEGDYTDALSKRQDILESDVIDVKEFVLKVGEAIYNSVK
jgi:hypothetical protein